MLPEEEVVNISAELRGLSADAIERDFFASDAESLLNRQVKDEIVVGQREAEQSFFFREGLTQLKIRCFDLDREGNPRRICRERPEPRFGGEDIRDAAIDLLVERHEIALGIRDLEGFGPKLRAFLQALDITAKDEVAIILQGVRDCQRIFSLRLKGFCFFQRSGRFDHENGRQRKRRLAGNELQRDAPVGGDGSREGVHQAGEDEGQAVDLRRHREVFVVTQSVDADAIGCQQVLGFTAAGDIFVFGVRRSGDPLQTDIDKSRFGREDAVRNGQCDAIAGQ